VRSPKASDGQSEGRSVAVATFVHTPQKILDIGRPAFVTIERGDPLVDLMAVHAAFRFGNGAFE
jgi:hypothetical protein